MSAFVLKIIALLSMTCDHISYVIFDKFSNLNYIGRLAFPIFAFQISEGYTHTKSLKKYFLRLFVFALIAQIPFQLFISTISSNFSLNVFFTLLLGLTSIKIFDMFRKIDYKNQIIKYLNLLMGFMSVISIAAISQSLHCLRFLIQLYNYH